MTSMTDPQCERASEADWTISIPNATCQRCRKYLRSTILASDAPINDQLVTEQHQSDRKGWPIYKSITALVSRWVIDLKELAERRHLCSFCHLLSRLVRQIISDVYDYEANENLYGYYWAGTKLVLTGDSGFYITNQSSRLAGRVLRTEISAGTLGRTEHTIIALPKAQVEGAISNKEVSMERVDFDTVRSWLHLCLQEHDECRKNHHVDASISITVIDVQRGRKCLLPSDGQYTALSYVWGGDTPSVELENEEAKAKERSFDSAPDSTLPINLPKTLRDAMEITRLLGERYLWVDRLCVPQDIETRSSQIAKMSRIYENALVTIIAAGGTDAHAGLCGLSAARKSPDLSAYYDLNTKVDGVTIAVTVPIPTSSLLSSKWNTRGWTFQERFFSNRQLIFADAQVFWSCKSAILFEDTPLQRKSSYDVDRFLDTIVRRFPEAGRLTGEPAFPTVDSEQWLDEFVFTIQEYTSRNLTYESDILAALQSTLNFFESVINSQMIWGLPEAYFYESLFWASNSYSLAWDSLGRDRSKDLTRRITGIWPSWSWVGWKGNIKFDRLSNSKRTPGDPYGSTTRPKNAIAHMRCWIKDVTKAQFRLIEYQANLTVRNMHEVPQTSRINIHANNLDLGSHHLFCASEYILFDALVAREGYKGSAKKFGLVSEYGSESHNCDFRYGGGQQRIHPLRTFSASELGLVLVYEAEERYEVLTFALTLQEASEIPIVERLGFGWVPRQKWQQWPVKTGLLVLE